MVGTEGGGRLTERPSSFIFGSWRAQHFISSGRGIRRVDGFDLANTQQRESEGAELDSSANADESRVTTTAKMARRETFCTPSQSWVFLWLSLSFFSLCCKSWRIFMIFLCDIFIVSTDFRRKHRCKWEIKLFG